MDGVRGGGGVRRRPPTGDTGMGVLGQLREKLRVDARPTPVTNQPSETFRILVSCLFGTYLLAFGGLLQITTETDVLDYKLGGTTRTKSFCAGLQMSKVEGVTSVEATVFKTLENNLASFAILANHSSGILPWYQRTSLTIGASHAYPSQDLVLKGRLSSRGIGSVLAKKSIYEKFSLVLSSEFDYSRVQDHLQEGLKFGIIFSIP